MAPPKSNVNPAGSGPFFHAKGHEVSKGHKLANGGNSWDCQSCGQDYDPDEVFAEHELPEDDGLGGETVKVTKPSVTPSLSPMQAAQKVSALLDGTPDVKPSGVVQMEAPAGLANMGERLVGQNKTAKQNRRCWQGPGSEALHAQFNHRIHTPLANVSLEGEHFDHHHGAWLKIQGNSLYVANKLIGDSRVSHDTPLSHIDLYSAYKSTPHAPASTFLKYLVHRINHVEDYEDPTKGHKLDVAFKELVQRGGAAEKNGHISIQDLHDWTDRHATTVVPQLLAEKQRMQMDVARGIGLNVRSINGEPHVALTRGLNSDIMQDEHSLSSHADTVDTGFGSDMHHSWVPLKDLWFLYDLDRTARSHIHMGPEDEALISNTGPRYEASAHDVKKNRIKRWPSQHPYVYDDMSDESLAKLLSGASSNPDADNELKYAIKDHKNAGPAVWAFERRRFEDAGMTPELGRPPIGAFGYKWYPREEVMKAAALSKVSVDGPAWFRNQNLNAQDLETLSAKLFDGEPKKNSYSGLVDEGAQQLLTHPAMNSHVLERIWRAQHGSPWAPTLLESPLATHQMREDAIEQAKFMSGAGLLAPLKLMRAVTSNPHHTEEQAQKVFDWAVQNGMFRDNEDLHNAIARAKLPAETVLKLYDRRDELGEEQAVRNSSRGFEPGGHLTPDERREYNTLGAIKNDFMQVHPDANVVARVAASKPGRVSPLTLLQRLSCNGGTLEPVLQAALITECEHLYGHGTPHLGSTRQPVVEFLEKLAGAKGLSQESINYLAHYKDNLVREVLGLNKSIAPEQLRAAFPKGVQFPERSNIHYETGTHTGTIAEELGQAYWRRKQYAEKKAKLHFIKPLPADLAKSSEEDLWRAAARHWLADQTTKGFYAVIHKDVAEGALRDKAIEPQFTDELLDGEAVFGRPATPENLIKLQKLAGPDEVVAYFETPVAPREHTDGSLYWTERVPCETIQLADVGDEPLAKMHTPLTFPKLGVEDDRRETKVVTTPRERQTFNRAAGNMFARESYVTDDRSQGDIYERFRENPAMKQATIDRDTATIAKDRHVGAQYTGNAGVGHPGHGAPRDERDLIPDAGTGASATSAAFAPSSAPRRKLNPAEAAAWSDPTYLPSTLHHEDLHRIFARVQHKHGERGREMLARNLVHVLPQDLQSAVMKHLFYAQPKNMNEPFPEEEAITELTSYLNSPQMRDGFHKKQQHSSEQQKAFHDKMKRAYRLLLAVSPTVDEGWLHHEKPWMKRGVAMRKFTEPQSGTGLSAAEAHEVFRGSNKLTKSRPDLLDANSFAFAFETDPTLMDSIDARHWELELRKMGSLNEYPTAASNFIKEFQKRTVHNGFDERLGRYHNTTGDNTEGTLIVMSPRIKAWSDKPTVGLDWIQALKQGNGDGHRSMKFITDLADKHGVSVELHVGSDGGAKTSPKSMLHKFYKKHGFVKRGKFEKDILVRHATTHAVTEPGETLKLGSTMRTIKKAEEEFDLAKMAVVHDDPESPMTVYRVEDPETNLGPYTDPDEPPSKVEPPRGQTLRDRTTGYRRAKTHPNPEPETDFDARDYRDFEAQYKKVRFGFMSRQDAYNWFGRDLSGAVREQEHPPSYKVVKVLARKVWKSRTGKQVFFVPHKPVKKSEPEGDVLEKMSVFHDDPKNPRKVYRVEDYHGRGPYQNKYDVMPDKERDPRWAAKRPNPGRDFPAKEWSQNPEGGVFGFARPEDAVEWFGPHRLARLKATGFELREVLAHKAYLSNSGRQVVFQRSPPPPSGARPANPVVPVPKVKGPWVPHPEAAEHAVTALRNAHDQHLDTLSAAFGKLPKQKQVKVEGLEDSFQQALSEKDAESLKDHPFVQWARTVVPEFGQSMQKSEDFVLPTESILKPGEESAAKLMLGHRKDHETALKAARFLTGRKEPVDENLFTLALNVFDGDFERAALFAVGMTDSEANLKALRAALKLGEFSQETTELSKNEPGTPHIESVNPGAPDATPTADEVKRGVTAGLVQPLKLGGKHSKGSMAVRDPKTGNTWLLKPGAGKASPAAGVRDGASSQSAREAAFWHCMDRTGLGNYGPKCDLLEVNGGQVAAMKLLGPSWKSADEQNRKVDGWAREILQPYLDRGDVHRIAALFWVLGESDAHGQNVLVHAESIALIDHGSSFAGPNFNPGRDSKSFTPYILRVFAPAGYTKKKPEDRISGLPVLMPAGDIALRKWVHSIDPGLISETMGSHGIGQVEQEAVLERLNDLQHHEGPSLSRYVNELWAGVVLPPHLRS
jgi:hypothetical protein